jgi:hypothetical protein
MQLPDDKFDIENFYVSSYGLAYYSCQHSLFHHFPNYFALSFLFLCEGARIAGRGNVLTELPLKSSSVLVMTYRTT